MRCLTALGAVVVTIALSLLFAGAADADVLLAAVSRPTTVAAYSGAVAWSSYDPARGRYSLILAKDGHVSRAPVAARRAPFDVSLGPTSSGKVAAVYSRCTADPGRSAPADVVGYLRGLVANPQTGRGCRIREYVLGEHHERIPRIRGLSAISTAFPSTWRGRVVFAGSRVVRGHLRTAIYTAATRGVSRARRLTTGPQPPAKLAPRVTGTALRGNHVVFGWDWQVPGYGGSSGVFSASLGSHDATALATGTEDETQFFTPGFSGTNVQTGNVSSARGRGGISFLTAHGPLGFVDATPYVSSTAVDGRLIYYTVSTASEPNHDCTAPGVAGAPMTCGVYLSSTPVP